VEGRIAVIAQLSLTTWIDHVKRFTDRLIAILPFVFLSLMAMVTYWLVKNAPAPLGSQQEKPPVHIPDYFMKDFSVKAMNAQGQLKSVTLGKAAHHFSDTDTLEIEAPVLRAITQTGAVTRVSAISGISNGDATEVQLMGRAALIRDAMIDNNGKQLKQIEIRSEFLHYFALSDRIQTHLPVEISRDKDRFNADQMSFDNINQTMVLEGRVKGVLAPKK
jgi:lipopolysaccharide export system protein LptC